MQKISAYSLALSVCLAFSASLYSSTVWKYDYTTIAGHIEDEIDKRFQPGIQSEAMKVELAAFKRDKKTALARAVEKEHYQKPFRTQQEAKAYATELAKAASNEFFDKILEHRIAMKMANLPSRAGVFKDQFIVVARTYVQNKAFQEATQTGRLTHTLKNVEYLITEALKANFEWTCEVCTWLRNQ